MEEPTFDSDGYPTEETLRKIEDWTHSDPHGWLDFCIASMHATYSKIHDYRAKAHDDAWNLRVVIFITGGWSGNESVIGAMSNNPMWLVAWAQCCRGGMHTFMIPDSWQKHT